MTAIRDDISVDSIISDLSSMTIAEKSPMSFYIARVETSQNHDNLQRIIEHHKLGSVKSVQFIPRTNDKKQSYYSVIVHLTNWNDCYHSNMIRNAIRNNEVYKFYYDNRAYWNISKNQKDTGFAQTMEQFNIKPVDIPTVKYDPRVIHYNAEMNLTYGYKPQNKAWEGQEIIEVQQQTIEDLKSQLKELSYELHKTERMTVKTLNELSEDNLSLRVNKLAAEEWKQKYDDILNAFINNDYEYIWNFHVPVNRTKQTTHNM